MNETEETQIVQHRLSMCQKVNVTRCPGTSVDVYAYVDLSPQEAEHQKIIVGWG